jgi:hypothetical protein
MRTERMRRAGTKALRKLLVEHSTEKGAAC